MRSQGSAILLPAILLPILSTVMALACAIGLLSVGVHQVLFLFVPAVMLAAWHGGRLGGLVATLSALILVDLFLLPPEGVLWPLHLEQLLLLIMFTAVCLSVTLLTAGRQRVDRERVRALREAEDARHDAEINSRLKDQFLATLSHELRTPLNAVLGWARMLARGQVERDKIPSALASIERNAQAQKQLVDDLLDVSAIISGRLRLDPREIDLTDVVRGAVDSVRLSFEARQHHLHEQLDPVTIVGDADRLRQVVWNLLSNAAKFTPDGGDIFVRVERDAATARISVRDTGRGIGQEFLPYVFEPFRQADSSITRASGGLGLGLSLVRHLVEAHGGSVSVSSDGARQGATFVVSLPLLQAVAGRHRAPQAEGVAEPPPQPSDGAYGPQPSRRMGA
jgi:signal transduction histidine kinase